MPPPAAERIFNSGDLPSLSLPGADGLITCRWLRESHVISVTGAVTAVTEAEGRATGVPANLGLGDGDLSAERRRAQVGFMLVEPAWLVRAAAERVRAPGIDAVVLHTHPSPPGRSALALAFASYLRNVLRRPATGVDPRLANNVVTSGLRPDLRGFHDLVRVPHLVTITDGTGAVADTIVWEIMTGSQFDAWLGGAPRPDQQAIEAHLPGLLRLRGLQRLGRLDHRFAGVLADIPGGGPLTTRLIHCFPRLVLPLAAAA
ncbi:hypothetical protein [Frankia sp. R82]|uniref:hypothetical protein n=1 Tax=Frankia sp. R82 TaxID=2950553 RepID=UPI002042F58A|nr:hypothetical protein [Frankia sp. R82]MCM3884331.1 hypothetical protein [Frankia sp. R82]